MNRRVWTPFWIAFLAGTLLIPLERPVGEFLGLYNSRLGYAAVELFAGLPIGSVAAAASRTWRGLLTLLLGFATGGAAVGTIFALRGSGDPTTIGLAARYVAVSLGILGVPGYTMVMTAVYVVSQLRTSTSERKEPTLQGRIEDGTPTSATPDGPVPGWHLPAAKRSRTDTVLGVGALVVVIAMLITAVSACVYTWMTA